MKTGLFSKERLTELLAKFSTCRVAVVGDFFLDKYLDINPAWDEPSIETGKIAYQVQQVRVSPGAAGTVVSNLASLGAGKLEAVGFTGDDGEGFELKRALEQLGCGTEHLHLDNTCFTPTYLKPRDRTRPGLEGEHSRYDTKNRTPTPSEIERAILQSLETLAAQVDAIVVLDQVDEANTGVVTTTIREAVSRLAREHPHLVFWADSRVRIQEFRHLLIKPNQYEAMAIDPAQSPDAIPVEQLIARTTQLRQQNQAPVFATRGAEGILVCDTECTLVPGVKLNGPIDPTGAGDSTTAGCVLALCAGASCEEAALVGNLTASLTVEQLATTGTATCEQILSRWELWHKQQTKL